MLARLLLMTALGAFFAAPVLAGGNGVTLEASRALFVAGETIEVTITNGRSSSIFLPGCGALLLERFEAERYVPIVVERCVSEGTAVEVPAGTRTLSLPADSSMAGSIYRISVAYGWGCSPGMALSAARCQDFGTASSSNLRVNKHAGGSEGK